MSKPTGYIVRPKDMKALVRRLNRPQTSLSEFYDVARTLIGWAEPQQTQQTQLPPEADALDRIGDALRDHTHKDDWGVDCVYVSNLWPILRETGRL